jgi:hypothetical protein
MAYTFSGLSSLGTKQMAAVGSEVSTGLKITTDSEADDRCQPGMLWVRRKVRGI